MPPTTPMPVVRTIPESELLKVYKHRLELANRKFDKRAPRAKEMLRRYQNRPSIKEVTPTGHRVSVPTGTAIIDALFSSMTAVEVEITAENVGTGTRTEARLAESGIRDVWREQKVDRKSDRAIKEGLIVGIGWVKTDYEYREETFERARDREAIKRDIDGVYRQAEAMGQEPPDPGEVADLVPMRETVTEVVRDRIVVDHVPWEQVRYDPTAKRAEDIRWVCQFTVVPVHEVKENPVYREFVKQHRNGLRKLRELKPDVAIRPEGELDELASHDARQEDDDERMTLCELWDFETGMVTVFPKEGDLVLHQRPNPLFLNDDLADKSPFVPLVLRVDPEDVWGLSDLEVVLGSLDELTEYRSNLATYIARMIPKLIGPAGGFTEAGKAALQSREWGAYCELEGNKSAQDVQPLQPPQLPQEVFGIPEKIENSIREATGVNELMRGFFPEKRRTATETNEVVAASASRQSEKRNLLERFFLDIARRVLQLMQLFYTRERVARLVEDAGDVVWEYTDEDIASEQKLACHLSPKEAKTSQTRRDNALAVANMLLSPAIVQSGVVDVAELTRFLMEEMGWSPVIIRNILRLPEEQQAETIRGMATQALGAGLQTEAAETGASAPAEVLAGIAGASPGSEQAAAV